MTTVYLPPAVGRFSLGHDRVNADGVPSPFGLVREQCEQVDARVQARGPEHEHGGRVGQHVERGGRRGGHEQCVVDGTGERWRGDAGHAHDGQARVSREEQQEPVLTLAVGRALGGRTATAWAGVLGNVAAGPLVVGQPSDGPREHGRKRGVRAQVRPVVVQAQRFERPPDAVACGRRPSFGPCTDDPLSEFWGGGRRG